MPRQQQIHLVIPARLNWVAKYNPSVLLGIELTKADCFTFPTHTNNCIQSLALNYFAVLIRNGDYT